MAAAIGSVTVTNRTVFGNKRIVIGYINFTNSTWTSGGLAFDGSNVGIGSIDLMVIQPGDLQYYYNYTSKKVDGYLCSTAGAAQVQTAANGATVTTDNVYFMIIGKGKG
jgi:hypothetical protein